MESIEEIDLLFKSGNDVPVTRATITMEQWEAVKIAMIGPEPIMLGDVEVTGKRSIPCLELFSEDDLREISSGHSAAKGRWRHGDD